MNKLKLPYFKEEIDIHNIQDEYETEFEFNDKEVDVFLNEMQIADEEQFGIIKNVLENISDFDKQNRSLISENFENKDGLTFEYLSYHLEELKEEFADIVDFDDTEIRNIEKLLSLLKITTISFYSDLTVFDYCLDDEISDQLLAVKMDRQKELSLDWES
ncbi:DUF2004 domain-containing protein [Tenacibaculum maritimum]|uniref:DUF2004 domain-containing protein n=1 Tax=Tenacibaculum maritimum TaxID=107401 RepID=UPI0010A4D074|nr:DUF2004 domain-containing protein [Tenacibaculum maritimum]MCD9585129.1 DUF2004 domain-containing protein [Tenacibaculum maritimum]MCD9620779.1 DUF2004 domain-containing protein [Tenacibaculum maritimum]MCD9628447.1 DUF2004 domain-containing protein [Tenacibaculum maritimum]MCD9630748.1 DUF2004 domain-containing protein [Tenacibaculum maritimum]MCD9632531.1 DUF2004 domain-containing protein [Tenacibaculum maritimum]